MKQIGWLALLGAPVVAFVAVACDDGATTTDGATSTGSGSSSASTGTSGLSCAEVDPQCPNILASAPCGGDPRGTWKYTHDCGPPGKNALVMPCEGETLHSTASTAEGTMVIDDVTIVRTGVKLHAIADVIRNKACLEVTCAEFIADALEKSAETCCEETADRCACRSPVTVVVDDSGASPKPYTIDGTKLLVGTTPAEWGYCVDGDTLTIADDGYVYRLVRAPAP